MLPLETLLITYNICYYCCLFSIQMLLVFDKEVVINLTILKDGGGVIYASWDAMRLIVDMLGIWLLIERYGGIILTRLGQWVSTNDGVVACSRSNTITVIDWEEGVVYWIYWEYGYRLMGEVWIIINPIILVVLVDFIDTYDVVIINELTLVHYVKIQRVAKIII